MYWFFFLALWKYMLGSWYSVAVDRYMPLEVEGLRRKKGKYILRN